MRLIDADLLKQNCKCTGKFEDNFICVDLITLAKVIDNQPTAYDVEAVVAELESKMLESSSAQSEAIIGMCGASANYYCGEKDAYAKAISIVRGKE